MTTTTRALGDLRAALADSADNTALDAIDAAAAAMRGDPAGSEPVVRAAWQAAREGGREPLPAQRLDYDGLQIDLSGWRRSEARRALLLASHPGPAADLHGLAHRLYRAGDEGERAAVTRALFVLPEPTALKDIALETGRANSLALYGSLALHNPYAAEHYSDDEYNQLVLKSLFTELPLYCVAGLQRRANRELSRMCGDYIEEREAAGRAVPCDIWLALAPHAGERGERALRQRLADPDARHRYYAVLAMGRRAAAAGIDADLSHALGARLGEESSKAVRELIRQTLDAN